jgi:phage-related protein
MPDRTYVVSMSLHDKPLAWLHGIVQTPPFSAAARVEAGYLLRALQQGVALTMPHSRPMPAVGPRCHELRIQDAEATWRIMYRVDDDAIVILEVFKKKTGKTPLSVLKVCRERLKRYDDASR